MLYIGLRSGWWTCCVSPWLGSWHTHTPSAGYGLLLPNDIICDVRLQHGPHWSWDWLCFQPKLLCKQNLTIIPHLRNKLLNPRVLESQSPILSSIKLYPLIWRHVTLIPDLEAFLNFASHPCHVLDLNAYKLSCQFRQHKATDDCFT